MEHIISLHAAGECVRRGIPHAMVEAVLREPEQIVPGRNTIVCYQSRVTLNQPTYLLRVMAAPERQPPVVVTVYLTSKVAKYRRHR